MNKTDAIQRINDRLGKPALTDRNTHFADIGNYGGEAGWWLKIPFLGFKQDLHFVLNNEKGGTFQYLKIDGGKIFSPAKQFRAGDGAAEAFLPSANPRRLADALPGGSKYNFTKHFVADYRH